MQRRDERIQSRMKSKIFLGLLLAIPSLVLILVIARRPKARDQLSLRREDIRVKADNVVATGFNKAVQREFLLPNIEDDKVSGDIAKTNTLLELIIADYEANQSKTVSRIYYSCLLGLGSDYNQILHRTGEFKSDSGCVAEFSIIIGEKMEESSSALLISLFEDINLGGVAAMTELRWDDPAKTWKIVNKKGISISTAGEPVIEKLTNYLKTDPKVAPKMTPERSFYTGVVITNNNQKAQSGITYTVIRPASGSTFVIASPPKETEGDLYAWTIGIFDTPRGFRKQELTIKWNAERRAWKSFISDTDNKDKEVARVH